MRESNLIPRFFRLEFRLPLSGAGSRVVTRGRARGEDGVVLAPATAEGPAKRMHTPHLGGGMPTFKCPGTARTLHPATPAELRE